MGHYSMELEECVEGMLQGENHSSSMVSILARFNKGVRRMDRNQVIAYAHINEKLDALAMDLTRKRFNHTLPTGSSATHLV